jgi:predicted nucleic acid-binding protein
MICADTSSLIAYWEGQQGPDVDLIDLALADQILVLAPVCLSELLSSPRLTPELEQALLQIPLLEIMPGFWERAGKLRARLMRRRYRPKLADTFIAQSCLDHQAPLVTRDRDFAAFHKLAGLRLL